MGLQTCSAAYVLGRCVYEYPLPLLAASFLPHASYANLLRITERESSACDISPARNKAVDVSCRSQIQKGIPKIQWYL
jgi:hypothetical protein